MMTMMIVDGTSTFERCSTAPVNFVDAESLTCTDCLRSVLYGVSVVAVAVPSLARPTGSAHTSTL